MGTSLLARPPAAPTPGLFRLAALVLPALVSASCGGCGVEPPVAVDPNVRSFLLVPASIALFVGQEAQLKPVAALLDGSVVDVDPKAVTWSVSSSAASVALGRVRGVAGGPAEVLARWSGHLAKASVVVSPAHLVSLRIEPDRLLLAVGETRALRLLGTLDDGSERDLTSASVGTQWTTSSAELRVDDAGSVSALAPVFDARVVALNAGLAAEARVRATATPSSLVRLDLTPPRATLQVGTSAKLVAQAVWSDGFVEELAVGSWSSSDEAVLGVAQDGTLSARAEGQAVASVSWNGARASAQVEVVDSHLVALELRPASLTLPLGATARFELIGTYRTHEQNLTDDPGTTITSEDPSRVAVTGATVTGVATADRVVVRARHGILDTVGFVTVLPTALTALRVEPSPATVRLRDTLILKALGTFADGTERDLSTTSTGTTWSIAPNLFVALDHPGVVRGLSRGGPALVTARNGTVVATVQVTTTADPKQILTMDILPAESRIDAGQTVQLTATARLGDGSTLDVTADAATRWTTDDALRTEVTGGLVGGLARGGLATITAEREGVAATARVVVDTPLPRLLTLTHWPEEAFGHPGDTWTLSVEGHFDDGSTRDLTAPSTGTTYTLNGDAGGAALAADSLSSTGFVVTLRRAGNCAFVIRHGEASTFLPVRVDGRSYSKLTVSPLLLELPIGMSDQLLVEANLDDMPTLRGNISRGATGTVYSSARPDVATVDEDGRVTAVSRGETNLRVTNGQQEGRVTVRVRSLALSSLVVTPASPSLPAGHTVQLTCTARLPSNRALAATGSVTGTTWVSGNPAVLAIDREGLARALAPGTASATCVNTGVTGTTNVTVGSLVMDEVTVTPAVARLPLGRALPLQVTVRWSDGRITDVTPASTGTLYFSADPAIAKVSADGVVTAIREGPVELHALVSGVPRPVQITVVPPELEAIECSPSRLSLRVGERAKVFVGYRRSDGARELLQDPNLQFRIADPGIASVDATGEVTGVAVGETSVRAYSQGFVAWCDLVVGP